MTDDVQHYMQKWSLTDPHPLAQTATSQVYTVVYAGERVVLKVLNAVGQRDEKHGAVALRHWNGTGAVRLLREDAGAHLLEYAPGEDLRAMVMRGDDERATTIIAEVLNQLHSVAVPAESSDLIPLRTRFRKLFAIAKNDARFIRAAQLAETLLDDPREVRVLHGDMHHENVRWRDGRGWLAFDPKGLIGERTFDMANTLCNPVGMAELVENEARLLNNATILAKTLAVAQSRLLAYTYAYAHLSASWSINDGDNPTSALNIGELIAPHLDSDLGSTINR